MPDDLNYTSVEQAILDIMANTDCPFNVAESFADLVYHRGWTFDNGYDRRSVRFIQPGDNGILFEVSVHEKHEFGPTYLEPEDLISPPQESLSDALERAGFPKPENKGRPYCANTENGMHFYAPEMGCAEPMEEDHA